MRIILAAVVVNSLIAVGLIAVALPAHAAVPCEDMLTSMREAKATAKLSSSDMKKVDELEAKAVERCNADDDTRSDAFLSQAMKLLGK